MYRYEDELARIGLEKLRVAVTTTAVNDLCYWLALKHRYPPNPDGTPPENYIRDRLAEGEKMRMSVVNRYTYPMKRNGRTIKSAEEYHNHLIVSAKRVMEKDYLTMQYEAGISERFFADEDWLALWTDVTADAFKTIVRQKTEMLIKDVEEGRRSFYGHKIEPEYKEGCGYDTYAHRSRKRKIRCEDDEEFY